MAVKKKAKPASKKLPPPKKMSPDQAKAQAKANSEAIQGTRKVDPVVTSPTTQQATDKASKKVQKHIAAASSTDSTLQLYKNYNSNYFLQFREALKYDYYVSLVSGKVEVLKLPKEEIRHLTMAKGKNDTPKHCAEIWLASLLPKTEAAVRILEAILKNPAGVVNINVDEAPKGDATTSPLKTANEVKVKDGEKVICLKKVCADAGIDPKVGRRILRARGQKPAGRWEWPESAIPTIMEVLRSGKSG